MLVQLTVWCVCVCPLVGRRQIAAWAEGLAMKVKSGRVSQFHRLLAYLFSFHGYVVTCSCVIAQVADQTWDDTAWPEDAEAPLLVSLVGL